MTRRGRALLFAAALGGPTGLAAQNPPTAPPPVGAPVRSDTAHGGATGSARADSTRPDTVSADSFSAVLPPLGPPVGPMPQGSRLVFDHDALVMSGAFTLGELIREVPGTFLVRTGWYGFPEVVHYAGQGASSVELYWDGYALDPMGEDSAGYDLSRIPLGLFRRVEVEVLPTVIRVYLISDTQPARHPRTETSFGTGDGATNSYLIRYLNRWGNGLGAGLGVNWFGTSGVASTPAKSSDLTLWAKGTWAPTSQTGFEYEYIRYSLDRDVLVEPQTSALIVPGRRVWRSDGFLRAHAASRPDGMGLRFDVLFGTSSYGDSASTVARSIAQGATFLAYRAERWSAEAHARVRDDRVPFEVGARVAATPLGWITVEASALTRSLLGGRTSREASAAVSAQPLGPLRLRGSVRLRDAVAQPAVLTDSAQRVTDWSVSAGLAMRRLELEAALDRHGPYAAPAYGTFAGLVPFGTSQGLRTLTVTLAYRPTPYFTLAGWDREPLVARAAGGVGTASYEPPHHTRMEATFRSRFLPHFRRGALDLEIRIGAEAWSDGVMGTDSTGSAIHLDGHGAVDWLVEFRLLGAVIYWSLGNAQVERYETVPGALMARASQRYGVRWEFTN